MVGGGRVPYTGPGGKPVTWLRPADKRARFDFAVSDLGDAAIGDLVRAELSGRGPATRAKVIERIGDPFAPRSLSMIAIARHDISPVFGAEVLAEAEQAAKLQMTAAAREDYRTLPIVSRAPLIEPNHEHTE